MLAAGFQKVFSDFSLNKNMDSQNPNDLGTWEDEVLGSGALPGKESIRRKAHPFTDVTERR